MSLNPQQDKAASWVKGPLLCTACPGSGKCITGDSIIFGSSDNRLSEIQFKKDGSVLSLDRESINGASFTTGNIGEFVDSGVKSINFLTTDNGYSLKGTLHHPISILNKDGQFIWRMLSDIKVGEVVPIYVNINAKTIILDDKWHMMGLLMGDGSLVNSKVISFHQEPSELTERYIRCIDKFYQAKVKVYKDKRRKYLCSYVINSISFVKSLLSDFGEINHYAKDKYITREILNGNYDQLGSFIIGLFDSDGYVDKSTIGITLASSQLISQLQSILLNYGIFVNKSEKWVKGVPYYRLTISGTSYRKFVCNLGFIHVAKKYKSEKYCCKKSNPNRNIPFAQSIVKSISKLAKMTNGYNSKKCTWSGNSGSIRLPRYYLKYIGSRNLTTLSSQTLLNLCEEYGISCSAVEQLRLLTNFEFTTVKSNTSFGEEHVYDYFVENNHNFIANGFINHNTTVLTERVVRLVNSGVKPVNILGLTFTNKAANEMKERIIKNLGDDGALVFMSTFHSLCANILRTFGGPIGLDRNMTIADSDDQVSLLEQVARQLEIDITKPRAKNLATVVNNWRENMQGEAELDTMISRRSIKEEDKIIILAYVDKLRRTNQADFSGLLSETVNLLENYGDVLNKLQKKFHYIQVDEYQDTNRVQAKIANLIAAKHRNIIIVGDSDQTVYTWRGACAENFKEFLQTYPEAEICPLGKNYRSTPQIIAVADKLIRHNPNRMAITFTTDNDSGDPVKLKTFNNPEEEAEGIADQIERHISTGIDAQEIAVFYRMNAMSRAVETQLRRRRVPYQIIGGASYYDRMEIRDIIAMMKFMCNPKDGVAFHRIANKPTRGLGNVAIGHIEKYAEENDCSILKACENVSLFTKSKATIAGCAKILEVFGDNNSNIKVAESVVNLIEQSSYFDHLKKIDKDDSFDDRKENVEEFVNTVAEYCTDNPKATISSFLQSISLYTTSDKEVEESKVSLMSLHASKGLEFNIVYMIGLEQNILPHKKAMEERPLDGVEEERRLCYVGFTRAKNNLYVSWCRNRMSAFRETSDSQKRSCLPSQFLLESGLMNQNDYKKAEKLGLSLTDYD